MVHSPNPPPRANHKLACQSAPFFWRVPGSQAPGARPGTPGQGQASPAAYAHLHPLVSRVGGAGQMIEESRPGSCAICRAATHHHAARGRASRRQWPRGRPPAARYSPSRTGPQGSSTAGTPSGYRRAGCPGRATVDRTRRAWRCRRQNRIDDARGGPPPFSWLGNPAGLGRRSESLKHPGHPRYREAGAMCPGRARLYQCDPGG
jgi:hypothetical protein